MNDLIFKASIAEHLKLQRKNKGWSLDVTAKATGVSKAMLGQIERQESSPTIAILWKIASGLETSFSAFFPEESKQCASEEIFVADPAMKIKTLFPFQVDCSFEMFEIKLTDHHQQMSSAHGIGVIEHVYILEGELSLYYEGQWHPLTQGESTRFFADQMHGYQALSETAVFQNIVTYPR